MIFLTSKEEQIDELFGLKMGADDFIRKPFSQRLLAERVKAVLRRASPKDGIVPKEADSKVLERGLLTDRSGAAYLHLEKRSWSRSPSPSFSSCRRSRAGPEWSKAATP